MYVTPEAKQLDTVTIKPELVQINSPKISKYNIKLDDNFVAKKKNEVLVLKQKNFTFTEPIKNEQRQIHKNPIKSPRI